MRKINKTDVEAHLKGFVSKNVYIHSEATSYTFVRNFQVLVTEGLLAGDGPFRVALRFGENGWLRTEGLTEYEVDEEGRLILAGHDERGRMYAALELSLKPFPA